MPNNLITSGFNQEKAKKSTGRLACLLYWHQSFNEFPTDLSFVQQYIHELTLLLELIEVLL